MHHFEYKGDRLFCEDVDITTVAEKVGTPFYLYSLSTILNHYHKLDAALQSMDHLICYALKANSNLAICRALAEEGSGAEVVSGGELYRALRVGFPPQKVVFNGNGKTTEEIEYGLDSDILTFNVDSESELKLVNDIAGRKGRTARIALRVNPHVDPKTHHHIATGLKGSKFGIPIDRAMDCYQLARRLSNLEVLGIQMHIGSQIVEISPFIEALSKVVATAEELRKAGLDLRYINAGGGLGIPYHDEDTPGFEDFADAILPLVTGTGCTLIVEPGRVIVGNAGVLVTRVVHTKESGGKNFVIVDAAMNDLIRPSMYGSYHSVQSVERRDGRHELVVDLVGGVCEPGDFFARDRALPETAPGDLLALMSAGAYGSVMSSNYNSRLLLPEVMVSGKEFRLVRRRQTYEEMLELEGP